MKSALPLLLLSLATGPAIAAEKGSAISAGGTYDVSASVRLVSGVRVDWSLLDIETRRAPSSEFQTFGSRVVHRRDNQGNPVYELEFR